MADAPLTLVDWGMVLLAPLPFVDQYRKILTTRDLGAFDPSTCGILLACNILRIFFWAHRHFARALLYQSCLMVVVQLLLLELCVRTMRQRWKHTGVPTLHSLNDYMRLFWKWPSFFDYIVFLAGLSSVFGVLGMLFRSQGWYGEILGYLALGMEACVPMPQAYNNYLRKSTHGLSLALVGGWFTGDAFKVLYFIWTGTPFQFVLCGILQFSVDVLICWQVLSYQSATTFKPRHRKKLSSPAVVVPDINMMPMSGGSMRGKV
ncbi:hypothetical protein RI367_006232 [Sorochytrium milnesiophthora]